MTGFGRVGLVGILLASPGFATPPDGVLIRDVGFKTANWALPSGMRIVVEEDHSQPLIAIVAVVDVGSAQDPVGKEGLAHLVEHLTFRAKPDGKLQRSNSLSFLGAGSWNAFTSHDLTTYVTFGPTEAAPQLLSLEGHRLLSPLAGLDAPAFEVEVGVVKNELFERDERGLSTPVEAKLFGALYPPGHPYHRPVIGTEATLSALTLGDAESFVQQYYVPKNITLYVSGDVDLATIQKVFDASLPHEFLDPPASGPVSPPQRVRQEAPPVPPLPGKTQLETLQALTESPMLYIAWSLPGGFVGERYLERFARTMFERVSVRAATSGSDIQELGATLLEGRYGNTLICAVRLKTGQNPEKTLERVLDQVVQVWNPASSTETVVRQGVDFHRLQNLAVVDGALKTESVASRALEKAALLHWTGDAQAWGKELRGIYEVRDAKMQAFAYEWLTRERARALFVEPRGEALPARDTTGPPPVFAASDEIRAKIAPEALATYVHGPLREVRAVTLKNGLNVLLVQRNSAPTVAVTLGFAGGNATSEPLGAARLVTVLGRPTQTRYGPASRFGGRLALSADADTTYYSGRAASGNLENLLALLSDSVQTLHVDGSMKFVWNDLVNGQRSLDALMDSQANRLFLSHTYQGSPLGRMATAAEYEKLGTDELQTWIDRTLRPKGAVLAVVGDIDPPDAEKLVRNFFDDWEGAPDARAMAQPSPAPTAAGPVQVIRVDRPGRKQTEIRLGCSIRTPSPTDTLALRLLGARLVGRLASLARNTLGGSYGFRGGASLHRGASALDVHGAVERNALTRVLAVASKEMDGLGNVQLTEDEFGLLKWRQGISSNIRYATNAELAKGLVDARLGNPSVDVLRDYPQLLAAVTTADVARVGAACRNTAVLLLSGDPDVVSQALRATGH